MGSAPTSYRHAARLLLRDRLLDAARELLAQRPWAQITMAEIASGAGVSRQTLYNEFGSREQFAQAFVIREGERFIAAVEEAIYEHLDDPTSALAAALQAFLESAARDPLVGMLLADDGTGGMLPLLTTQSAPIVGWASERIAAAIRRSWPAAESEDAQLLAEALVRLAISYVTVPAVEGAQRQTMGALESTRRATDDAVRLLGPFIERAIMRAMVESR